MIDMIPVSGEVDGPISEEEMALFVGFDWGVLAITAGQPEEEKEMEMVYGKKISACEVQP